MNDFSYTISKKQVKIFWNSQLVQTLSDYKAHDFLSRVSDQSEAEVQRIMAKMTGNFKRGNEKLAQSHQRNR